MELCLLCLPYHVNPKVSQQELVNWREYSIPPNWANKSDPQNQNKQDYLGINVAPMFNHLS